MCVHCADLVWIVQIWLGNARYATEINARNPNGAILGLNGLADFSPQECAHGPAPPVRTCAAGYSA